MIIKEHKDFIIDYFEYNAWKTEASFPILKASDEEVSRLKKYCLIEFMSEGVMSDRSSSNFELKLENFKKEVIYEIFNQQRDNIFLFSIEHKLKQKTRIRSYKGLVDKSRVDKKDYCQLETDFENNNSIISFVAKVNSNNFDYLLNFFLDDSTCFIIKTNNNYLNEEFLDKALSCITIVESSIEINYLKLILLFGSDNDIIYRIGGDSGDEYWSLQKFFKNDNCGNEHNNVSN